MQDLRDVLHIEVNNGGYEVVLHDDASHGLPCEILFSEESTD